MNRELLLKEILHRHKRLIKSVIRQFFKDDYLDDVYQEVSIDIFKKSVKKKMRYLNAGPQATSLLSLYGTFAFQRHAEQNQRIGFKQKILRMMTHF